MSKRDSNMEKYWSNRLPRKPTRMRRIGWEVTYMGQPAGIWTNKSDTRKYVELGGTVRAVYVKAEEE